MKDWEYNVALVLSVGCLIVAGWIIAAGRANERLQTKFQVQQIEIERGNMSRQLGSRIVQDMMTASSSNSGIRAILEKYGIAAVPPKAVKAEKQVLPQAKTKGSRSTAGK
jgi:membrane protein YdbS with pleckstrin-like domain